MAAVSTNPNVRFLPVKGANHFSILAPTNTLIACKILGMKVQPPTLRSSRKS
jgi:hypothetical protein